MTINSKKTSFLFGFFLFMLVIMLPTPDPITEGNKVILLTQNGKSSLAVLIFCVVLWISESIPFSITGLLGIILLSITKAAKFEDLIHNGFGNPIIMFFIGVLIISAAINETTLLKRITSLILYKIGNSPKLIILAILSVGALLSGWIMDMAVAAMLLPICINILKNKGLENKKTNFSKAIMISCAWGPLIGGVATPAGCGPNPLTISFLKDLAGIDFSFVDWMMVGYPATIMMVPFAWIILLKIFPLEPLDLKISEEEYKNLSKKLGPLNQKEFFTLIIFFLTITLWISAPIIKKLSGGSINIFSISFTALATSLLFFMPGIDIISWEKAEKNINWGGIILIVSGLSIGMTIYQTGAAEWIAWIAFNNLTALHPAMIIFTIVFGVSIMKVLFSSNTVTGIIIVPLLIALAKSINISPALVAIPAGITSSLAFILVTSTPTNVIPYSAGYFSIRDMMKAGIWMTFCSAICVTISIYFIGFK